MTANARNPNLENKTMDKEIHTMAKSSNKIVVPEAKAAMEKFKMEAANEVGVNLKQG